MIEVNSADLKKDSAAAWATAQQSVNKKKTLVVVSSFEGMSEVKTNFYVEKIHALKVDSE